MDVKRVLSSPAWRVRIFQYTQLILRADGVHPAQNFLDPTVFQRAAGSNPRALRTVAAPIQRPAPANPTCFKRALKHPHRVRAHRTACFHLKHPIARGSQNAKGPTVTRCGAPSSVQLFRFPDPLLAGQMDSSVYPHAIQRPFELPGILMG